VIAYTIGSFADKQLELGTVLLAFVRYGSLRALVLTGLVFQTTKVVTFLVRIPPSPRAAIVGTVAAVALLQVGTDLFPMFLTGTALFTAAVSYLRAWNNNIGESGQREQPQKRLRDVVRACGFILAPFFSPLFVGAVTIAALVASRRTTAAPEIRKYGFRLRIAGAVEPNHVAMFIHHVHYFAYSHLAPFVFAVMFGLPVAWQGVAFYVGWIGYDLHDFVTVRATWSRFLLGHMVTAGGILLLFWSSSSWLAAVGWLVTGVGGGTYVMLRHLRSAVDPDPGENLELAEHYGHLIGVLILIALLEASATLSAIAITAAALAIISPLLALALRALPQRWLIEA